MTAIDRCHWQSDGEDQVLIPMCMGCAVFGPECCTCAVPESRIEAAENGRAVAEREVMRLRDARQRGRDRYQAAWREINRLRQRVAELEARAANPNPPRNADR